jgi:septation ring formation regulator EzrA
MPEDPATILQHLRNDLQNTNTAIQNLDARLTAVERSMEVIERALGPIASAESHNATDQQDPVELRLNRLDRNLIAIGRKLGIEVEEPSES